MVNSATSFACHMVVNTQNSVRPQLRNFESSTSALNCRKKESSKKRKQVFSKYNICAPSKLLENRTEATR